MKKITSILFLAILTISCLTEKEKQLNEKSQLIFNKSVKKLAQKKYYRIDIYSFRVDYKKYKSENPQKGLDFAISFEKYSNELLQKREEIEQAENIRKAQSRQIEVEKEEANQKEWVNSKYGKLQKKHPNWSNEECIRVLDNKIWIGMSLEMLKYQRGLPNSSNPSNYGSGIEYQWCWDDYNPSCFYGGEDGIITAYN